MCFHGDMHEVHWDLVLEISKLEMTAWSATFSVFKEAWLLLHCCMTPSLVEPPGLRYEGALVMILNSDESPAWPRKASDCLYIY